MTPETRKLLETLKQQNPTLSIPELDDPQYLALNGKSRRPTVSTVVIPGYRQCTRCLRDWLVVLPKSLLR